MEEKVNPLEVPRVLRTEIYKPHLDVKVVSAGLEAVPLGNAGDDVDHVALVGELSGVVSVGAPVTRYVLQKVKIYLMLHEQDQKVYKFAFI